MSSSINESVKTKKKKHIVLKIFLTFILSIVGLFLVLFIGLNCVKFALYSSYYNSIVDICDNPGLNDGFIPQAVTVSEVNQTIFTTGYMKDKSNSRIYRVNLEDGNVDYITLTKNSKLYNGHNGGLASSGSYVFIANNSTVYTLSMKDCLEKDSIDIGEGIKVNNAASFCFCDDLYLYVGEFHNGAAYKTNHEIQTKDGTYYAICSMYSISDFISGKSENDIKPLAIYSIRNKVQGFAMLDNGDIVLSTSYGLSDSEYYVYKGDEVILDENEYLECPLYKLDNYSYMMKGPAMSEGLDIYDDRVLSLTESASNQYIFGKFFFAYKIVGIKF